MTKEEFKAKAKEIIDNEPFYGTLKLFNYDNIDEICVAQTDDVNNAVASYPLMDFLDELYEQIEIEGIWNDTKPKHHRTCKKNLS